MDIIKGNEYEKNYQLQFIQPCRQETEQKKCNQLHVQL